MAFDFPASPTNGQTFTPSGGPTYQWSSATGAWLIVGASGAAFAGPVPPSNPMANQLWWENDTGNTFIWYNDGNSSQWVQIAGQQRTSPGLWPTADSRNRIVNPAMQVSQEYGDNPVSTNGGYPADQWALVFANITGITANGYTGAPTSNGSPRSIVFGVGTAKPSLAAGDVAFFMQKVEGKRVEDLQWGTAAAKQVVIAFDVFSPQAGTFCVSVRNAANNRTWVGSYTIAAADVNKYVRRTMVVPGDTTGTWPKDNTWGLELDFTFVCGSTYLTATTGWQAGNFVGLSGMSNGASAVQNFAIGDVGLYLDPQNTGLPPPWQEPDYASELLACQRYFWRWSSASNTFTPLTVTQAISTTVEVGTVYLPVQMRANPTVTFSAASTFGAGTGVASAITTDVQTPFNIRVNVTGTGFVAYSAYLVQANNTGSAFMNVSARM